MTNITVKLSFADAGDGQAAVSIVGPDGFKTNYIIDDDHPENNPKHFQLPDGLYNIKVTGNSGAAATLSVTDDDAGSVLLNDNGGPGAFTIDDAFAVGN